MKKVKQYTILPARETAALVAGWLDDKQAADVRVLDVAGLSSICDVLVVATARGVRHAQALADHVNERLAEENLEMLGMEGYKSGEWVLQDLNDVIVHIFLEDTRSFYNLEGLWSEGKSVDIRPNPDDGEYEPGEAGGAADDEEDEDGDGDQ